MKRWLRALTERSSLASTLRLQTTVEDLKHFTDDFILRIWRQFAKENVLHGTVENPCFDDFKKFDEWCEQEC